MSTRDVSFSFLRPYTNGRKATIKLQNTFHQLDIPYGNFQEIFPFYEAERRISEYCPANTSLEEWHTIASEVYDRASSHTPPPEGFGVVQSIETDDQQHELQKALYSNKSTDPHHKMAPSGKKSNKAEELLAKQRAVEKEDARAKQKYAAKVAEDKQKAKQEDEAKKVAARKRVDSNVNPFWVCTDEALPSQDKNLQIICETMLKDLNTFVPEYTANSRAMLRRYMNILKETYCNRETRTELIFRVLVLYSQTAAKLGLPDFTQAHPSRMRHRYWMKHDSLVPTGDQHAPEIMKTIIKRWGCESEDSDSDWRNGIDELVNMASTLEEQFAKVKFEIWFPEFVKEWTNVANEMGFRNWMMAHPLIYFRNERELPEDQVIWVEQSEGLDPDILKIMEELAPVLERGGEIPTAPVEDRSLADHFRPTRLPTNNEIEKINEHFRQIINFPEFQTWWEAIKLEQFKSWDVRPTDLSKYKDRDQLIKARKDGKIKAYSDRTAVVKQGIAPANTTTAGGINSPYGKRDASPKESVGHKRTRSNFSTGQQTSSTTWVRQTACGYPIYAFGEPVGVTKEAIVSHKAKPSGNPHLNFTICGAVTPFNLPKPLRCLEDCMIIPLRNLVTNGLINLHTLHQFYPYDFTESGILVANRRPRGRPGIKNGRYIRIFETYLLVGSHPDYAPTPKNPHPWLSSKSMNTWRNEHRSEAPAIGYDHEASDKRVNWAHVPCPTEIDVSSLDAAWRMHLEVATRDPDPAIAEAARDMTRVIAGMNQAHPRIFAALKNKRMNWDRPLQKVSKTKFTHPDPASTTTLSPAQITSVREIEVSGSSYPSYPWMYPQMFTGWKAQGGDTAVHHPGSASPPDPADQQLVNTTKGLREEFRAAKGKAHSPKQSNSPQTSKSPDHGEPDSRPPTASHTQNRDGAKLSKSPAKGGNDPREFGKRSEATVKDSHRGSSSSGLLPEATGPGEDVFRTPANPTTIQYTDNPFDMRAPLRPKSLAEFRQNDCRVNLCDRILDLMRGAAAYTPILIFEQDDESWTALTELRNQLNLESQPEEAFAPGTIDIARLHITHLRSELDGALLAWLGEPQTGDRESDIPDEFLHCFEICRASAVRNRASRAGEHRQGSSSVSRLFPVAPIFHKRSSSAASSALTPSKR